MAVSEECVTLTKAFSGIGVDEKALISMGKWNFEQRKSFWERTPQFFSVDEHQFHKWNEGRIMLLKLEFLRFQSAVVLWTTHPWERDARMMKEAIIKGPEAHSLIIEIACTRSSSELLGARKAYHSLFDHSIEEDLASVVTCSERRLLVGLVSSYRYEGPHVHDKTAKSEARALHDAIKAADKKPLVEDEELVRILSTRSKLHLKAIFKHYKEIDNRSIDEDLHENLILKTTVQCLCAPEIYFSEVLDAALKEGADESTQAALTRVIVSQADASLKDIKAEYYKQHGVHLSERIEDRVLGNYGDFLLALVSRGD
ncbi:hypothetical protein Ancab_034724 [Ancistrocladus abbreviatus]